MLQIKCENLSEKIPLRADAHGTIRVGDTPPDDVWRKQITAAEALLIHVHTPAYNAEYIATDLAPESHNLRVFNWGQHRNLMPEVSAERWHSDEPGRLYGSP